MKNRNLILIVGVAILIILATLAFLAVNNNQVETKNYCSTRSEICTQQYDPVCGWFNVQCIRYPCAQTFGNSCAACQDEKVEYWTKGECPA